MAEKQRVMIVDDDANIAELISLYLAKECYETKIVYDGEEALKVFPEFRPNIILLDLMLPGMDGYQVCRELRTTSQVPIIMLSAKGEIFDKVLGLELGADDYMIKPFDSKELVARVKAVLRRYQAVPAPAPVTAATAAQQQGDYVEYPDLIVNFFTVSDFSGLLSRSAMLPLIVFSVLFGFGVNLGPGPDSLIAKFLVSLSEAMMKVVQLVTYYAPIAFFGFFADLVATYGSQIAQD